MAVRKVIRLGHPVLRKVAEPFSKKEILAPETKQLVQDMLETMDEYDGAGLAAPQVAVSKRLMVYGVKHNPRYPDAEDVPLTVLFNPEWEKLSTKTGFEWEGCLSVPDLRGRVRRFDEIKVRALGVDAKPVEFEAHGFHARVFQHEVDHLDGFVFLDRMEDMRSLAFIREWQRYTLGSRECVEEGE